MQLQLANAQIDRKRRKSVASKRPKTRMMKGRSRMKRDKFYPATDESSVERTEAPKEADSSNLETPTLPAMDYEK